MDRKQVLAVGLELLAPPPERLDVGAPFVLSLAVTMPESAALEGAAYMVFDGDKQVASGVLPPVVRIDPNSDDFDPRNGPVDARDRFEISLTAPDAIGAFHWRLALPAQECGARAYAQCEVHFSFSTGDHQTSLAVWDAPSPVHQGAPFVFKLGAKCSACCDLSGRRVEVRDEAGKLVANGRLGAALMGDASGLFWTEVEAAAPACEGLSTFTVSFPADEPGAPHRGATTTFSVMTVPEAAHVVTVTIIDKTSAAPVCDMQVRLGFHRGATDHEGNAAFKISTGQHRLFLWHAGYAAFEQMLDVQADLNVMIEAEALAPKDPYARWQA
jgi:hypothetical protein